MKLKSKLVGLNIFGQAMFAIIFFTALYFSYNAITEKIYSTTLIEKYSEDALDIYLISHLAESGDNEGVKESLNLKLDNYVYEIYSLMQNESEAKVKEKANNIMIKIASHRKVFPREANDILQRDVDEILKKLNE